MELGKFFPEKAGIKIPVYAQYSNTIKNPQYDPYDLDIELKDKLDATADRAVRDSLRQQAQDYTKIKSVNLTNVRKERTNSKRQPMPWDVENLSLTYAYSNTSRRTPIIQNDELKNHQGIIDYAYSRKVKYIEPFKNVVKKAEVAKYLKFFTNINFNPYPNSFAFSTRMQRQFQSTTYRFSDPSQDTWYNRNFEWDRSYDLKWDFSKSLKFNFNAINNTVIDELDDQFIGTDAAKEEIWSNIKDWGRNKNYQHNFNFTYNVPLKSIPYLDFIKVKAKYNAQYGWQAAALNVDTLGNIISNGQTRQLDADLNFVTLYNKSKFLKKINGSGGRSGRSSSRVSTRPSPKDDKGKDDKDKKDKKDKKDGEPSTVAKVILRPLMMIRKAKVSYSEQFSSVVPGFTPQHRILGMNRDFDAPGWDYITGWRQPDEDWLYINQNWITENIFLNQQVLSMYTQDANGRLTVEPFKDFRIELDADWKKTSNRSAYFKRTNPHPDSTFQYLAEQELGSYQISYYSMGTLFDRNYFEIFEQFEANREIISQRLATELGILSPHDVDSEYGDYYEGFGRYQTDVLIPAFLAAYNGKDANTVGLDVLRTIPRPNWKLTYNGLSKVKAFSKIFSNVRISHAYKSGLSINSFNNDLSYDDDNVTIKNENTSNYYSEYEIPNIVISEQLSPLVGIDMSFKNDLSAKLDWKKSRNLALSFSDYQLSETRSDEFVVGLGYRLKDVYIPFLDFSELGSGGKKKGKKGKKGTDPKDPKAGGSSKDKKGNDMNFKFDFSWRDDVTINHLLDQGVNVKTRGMKTIRISPSIDYTVNKQLNLRLFYDFSRTIPATSASFPITNTQAGLQIRFSLN
jgi:cell surface protein SprA